MNSTHLNEPQQQIFIDVGFIRIQRYLARTVKLRGRRAASAGLAYETDSERVAAALPSGLAEANQEAGAADGVVNLKLRSPESDPVRRRQQVDTVMDETLALLRTLFPAAVLQAAWGSGEDYLTAYTREIGPRTARGEVRIDHPALPEFPCARQCPLCRIDPATASAHLPDRRESTLVCADCAARLARRDRSRRTTDSVEEWLQHEIGADAAPDMLEDLVLLGARDAKRNHLVTVSIDGNAVGALFRALTEATAGDSTLREIRTQVSAGLKNCTREALGHGTLAVLEARSGEPDPAVLPVVPHVLGGDDVLVSVPASYAWRFTLGYLDAFDALASELVADIRKRTGLELPLPSASAGMVFARHSEPMYLLVELAEERLRAAKRATGGQASSVDFLDLTVDGPYGTDDPPLSRDQTDAAHHALDRLARLNQSLRSTLAGQLRERGDTVDAENTARTLRVLPAVQPFLDGEFGISLGHALRIATWWRPTTGRRGAA